MTRAHTGESLIEYSKKAGLLSSPFLEKHGSITVSPLGRGVQGVAGKESSGARGALGVRSLQTLLEGVGFGMRVCTVPPAFLSVPLASHLPVPA